MKFLVASALFGFLAVQSVSGAPSLADTKMDCLKMDEVIDEFGAAQGLTILSPKYKLAQTPEEYVTRCKEMQDAILYLRRYNKQCYTSLTNQVFGAMLKTRSQMTERFCRMPENKEGLESVKCIQENAFDSVLEAEKKIVLLSQVLHDANIQDNKLKVRRSCCSVIESKRLFLAATKEKCAKYEAIYADYVDSYTSEALGLICPSADKLECEKLEIIPIEGVQLKSKFFLTPMMKVVRSLDGQQQ